MMYELSKGFASELYCVFSEEAVISDNVNSDTKQNALLRLLEEWPQPSLQIVDIQRFPVKEWEKEPSTSISTMQNTPLANAVIHTQLTSCFYIAASDGEALVWILVLPHSKEEDMISSFVVDVGYCIVLRKYSVLIATNNKPVIVALELSFSRNPLSLQGAPVIDEEMFHLSPNALQGSSTNMSVSHKLVTENNFTSLQQSNNVNRNNVNDNANTLANNVNDNCHNLSEMENILVSSKEIDLIELLQHPEHALSNWNITLRLVWKGDDRVIERGSRYFRKMSRMELHNVKVQKPRQDSSNTLQSCKGINRQNNTTINYKTSNVNSKRRAEEEAFASCYCLAIDQNAVGIACTLYASILLLSELEVYDCLQIINPEIVWGNSSENAVSQLRVYEHNIYRKVDTEAGRLSTFPQHASRFVGSVNCNILPIASILTECGVDDVVSMIGRVLAVGDEVQVHTKRGRVMRRTVSFEDFNQQGCMIDLTLWGNLASQVEFTEGEVWAIIDCTVREFMRRKTLSSRASTALTLMENYDQTTFSNISYNDDNHDTNNNANNNNTNTGNTMNEFVNVNNTVKMYENDNNNNSNYYNNVSSVGDTNNFIHEDTWGSLVMKAHNHEICSYGNSNNSNIINTNKLLSNASALNDTQAILEENNATTVNEIDKMLDVSTPQLHIDENLINEHTPLLLRISELILCENELETYQGDRTENNCHSNTLQTNNFQLLTQEIEKKTAVAVSLSDGNTCIVTVTEIRHMIALLDEEDVLEVCSSAKTTSNKEQIMTILRQTLIGSVVLAWVEPRIHPQQLILKRCRQVNFAACAGVALNEIDKLLQN